MPQRAGATTRVARRLPSRRFLCAAAYALCHLFSGRGAFIQFGAMLGTIMVANVFFVIIPGQREMVRAKEQGREPDPQAGLRGKLRSVHNTYFTLPVLFTMISNHYALTFGARYNWLVLIAICLAGALIRVYFVDRHQRHLRGGHTSPWPAVLGVLIFVAAAAALAPRAATSSIAAASTPAAAVLHRAAHRRPAVRALPRRRADRTGILQRAQRSDARYARGHPLARGSHCAAGADQGHADRQSHWYD